jgi:hypothetical protein
LLDALEDGFLITTLEAAADGVDGIGSFRYSRSTKF